MNFIAINKGEDSFSLIERYFIAQCTKGKIHLYWIEIMTGQFALEFIFIFLFFPALRQENEQTYKKRNIRIVLHQVQLSAVVGNS